MASLSTFKARKEYTCSKCGATIHPGETYYRIEERFSSRPRFRCHNCRPERSELTGSEFKSWLYDLQDHLNERYDLSTEDGKDELYDTIQEQMDELSYRRDGMPEQLQEVGAGEILGNRIDSLQECLDTLDGCDYPDRDDDEYWETNDNEVVCVATIENGNVHYDETSVYQGDTEDELDKYVNLKLTDNTEEDNDKINSILLGYNSPEDTDDTRYDSSTTRVEKYLDDEQEVYIILQSVQHYDEEAYEEALEEIQSEIEDAVSSIDEG